MAVQPQVPMPMVCYFFTHIEFGVDYQLQIQPKVLATTRWSTASVCSVVVLMAEGVLVVATLFPRTILGKDSL